MIKFVREITGTRKDYQLQTLNRTEAEFIFELSSKLVNKIPYGKSKDHLYISPADIIQQSNMMISVTRTASKMGYVNVMGGLTKYTKALTEMRRPMLEADWEDFKQAV